jgi:hypothetical protein
MTRDILCDSGALISLTSACLDQLLYYFAEKNNVKFIIPPSVESESIQRPMKNSLKKYLFSAIRLKNAVDDGVVVVVDAKVEAKARRIMNLANNVFFIKGKPLKLIQLGESEMLALAKELGIEYILIDERTTRMFMEAPQRLKKHLEDEFKINVMVNKKNYKELLSEISPLKALRSSELVMLAYEQGFFKHYNDLERDAIQAALYKIKYSGCSLGFDEIHEYLSKVKHQ